MNADVGHTDDENEMDILVHDVHLGAPLCVGDCVFTSGWSIPHLLRRFADRVGTGVPCSEVRG